eukprot:5655311-Pleurochrysis_carterae.AAC.2
MNDATSSGNPEKRQLRSKPAELPVRARLATQTSIAALRLNIRCKLPKWASKGVCEHVWDAAAAYRAAAASHVPQPLRLDAPLRRDAPKVDEAELVAHDELVVVLYA